MSEELTKEVAYKALQKFFEEKPFVLFGTGTSCAVHPDYGMPALSRHLLNEIGRQELTPEQQTQWDSVKQALNEGRGRNLESAMNGVKDENLICRIVNSTADLVISLDRKHGRKILLAETDWPALSLFKRLVDGFSVLHVATPNYDLLAEYAFERADIPYTTGFVGGVCRRLDWSQAGYCMTYLDRIPYSKRFKEVPKSRKHINLYKVHGSLNTFKYNNQTIENNAWMFKVPDGIERVMITPGTMKYEKLHKNRADLLSTYDKEFAKHNAFLFIGFGFNDNQLINDSLKRKICDQRCRALIITRDSNNRIETLAKDCENLWLVCTQKNGDSEGTRIFNSRKGELYLDKKSLWDLKQFAEEILGG